MNSSENYIAEPILDMGLAVDHERKLFQVQLYATPYPDMEVPMIAAIYPSLMFNKILRDIQTLLRMGYLPIDDEILPSETEKILEQWI